MATDCEKQRSLNHMILAILLILVLLGTGCGPPYEERMEQQESERKEQEWKNKEEEKRKIDEVASKYNAVYFPPQNISATSFTYELEKFFKSHSGNPIVFRGYLEDIEETENNIFVEFICPLGKNKFLAKTAIRLRLTVPESKVVQFLEGERADSMLRLLRYIQGPDYFIVAKIINIQRVRKYEFYGSAYGEEVEIETMVSKSYVSTGQLIEAVAIQGAIDYSQISTEDLIESIK